MGTIYQTKEFIHNYLRDEYCMDQNRIYEFLNCVSPAFLDSIIKMNIVPSILDLTQVKMIQNFVDSMISYGNQKVENYVQDELERSKERKNLGLTLNNKTLIP